MSPNPYPPPAPALRPQTDGQAIASLVLGVMSVATCCGLFTGIPALILGLRARSAIGASGGARTGDGLAIAGMVGGVVGTLGMFVAGGLYVLGFAAMLGVAAAAPSTSAAPAFAPSSAAPASASATVRASASAGAAPRATGPVMSPLNPGYGGHDTAEIRRKGGATLKSLLLAAAAKDKRDTLLVVVYAPGYEDGDVFFESLNGYMEAHMGMGKAYPFQDQPIVRVDAVEWKDELASVEMARVGDLWFFHFDRSGKVTGVNVDDLADDLDVKMGQLDDLTMGKPLRKK